MSQWQRWQQPWRQWRRQRLGSDGCRRHGPTEAAGRRGGAGAWGQGLLPLRHKKHRQLVPPPRHTKAAMSGMPTVHRSHRDEGRPVGVRCLHCGSSSPGPHSNSTWRPHPATGERWVCSPCFFAVRRQSEQRQCLECGTYSPGTNWHRHPATGAEWLCKRCYSHASRQRKRVWQRQQDGEAEETVPAQQPSTCQPAAKRRRQGEKQQQAVEHAAEGGSGNSAPSLSQWQRQKQQGRQQWQRQLAEAEEEEEDRGEEEQAPSPLKQQASAGKATARQHRKQQARSSKAAAKPARTAAPTVAMAAAAAAQNPSAACDTRPAQQLCRQRPDVQIPAQVQQTQHAKQQEQQEQQVEQQQQQPHVQQAQAQQAQHNQDLFGLLLAAAGSPVAAAAGLTPELAASFMTLMDLLPAEIRAAREPRMRTLLAQGMQAAAAQLMNTALALHFGPPPASNA